MPDFGPKIPANSNLELAGFRSLGTVVLKMVEELLSKTLASQGRLVLKF